jgi:hypothetical protein
MGHQRGLHQALAANVTSEPEMVVISPDSEMS